MALIYNGNTISPGTDIKYKGVSLQKIIYKAVTVWQKYINSTGTVNSNYFSIEYTTSSIAGSESPGDPNNMQYSRGTMSGDVLSWSSKGAIVKANCNCTVSVSGTLRVSAQDGPKAYKAYYYKNNSNVSQFAYEYLSYTSAETTHTLKYTISLKAGDTFSVRIGQAESSKGRLSCSIKATFTGTPV